MAKEENQAKRWVEHFKEDLNWPDPSKTAYPTPTTADSDILIDTYQPTIDEDLKQFIMIWF